MSPHRAHVAERSAAETASRQRPSAGDIARGLAAGLALTALVVGVPLALVVIARTLPIHWPSSLSDVVATPDDGSLLLLALVVAGWIAWAVFTASVAVEAGASLRGIPTPALPGLGLSQRCVAGLVTAVFVMIAPANTFAMASPVHAAPEARAAVAPARAGAPAAEAAVRDTRSEPTHQQSAVPLPAMHTRVAARELPTITVHRHDTLWGLAEKHLGKGTRYPEIFELNRGHRQSDGSALEDPDLIYPGWVLRLPADARHVLPPAHAGSAKAASAHAPAARPIPAHAPATDEMNAPPCVVAPTSAPPTVAIPAPATPERITTGPGAPPASDEPAGDGPPASSAAVPVSPSPTTTTVPGPAPVSDDPNPIDLAPAPFEADLAPVPAPALLLGLGALTLTGLMGEVGRRRRRQRAMRRPGERIPMPEGETARAETLATSMAAPASADLLERALRRLAAECERTDRALPDVRVALSGPESLEIHLGSAEPGAVAPFRALDATTWELDPSIDLGADGGVDDPGPYPVLVVLGVSEGRQVLLNLESVGTLHVSGPDQAVHGVMRALAVDLAVGASTSRCFPVYAGCFEALSSRLDPARARYESETAAAERSLARRVADDVAIDRLARRIDNDPADVVISVERLRLAPGPYSGAVLISTSDQVTGTALLVDDDGRARLGRDGPSMLVQQVVEADLSRIVDLLATAERSPIAPEVVVHDERLPPTADDGAALHREEVEALPEGPPLGVAALQRPTSPTLWVPTTVFDLTEDAAAVALHECRSAPRILLLGPVNITGASTPSLPARRRRLLELLTFLALNPGVTGPEIDDALWPGRRVEKATRNTTVHRARQWLGEDPEGVAYLPRLRDREQTYSLHPDVSSDWTDFQVLARRGLAQGPSGLPDLHAALALVRGRPFQGVDPASYAWAEPHIQEMIGALTDLAHLVSATHLAEGDARSALKAATVGLSVDDASALLSHDAITAAEEAGDRNALERLLDRRARICDEDTN